MAEDDADDRFLFNSAFKDLNLPDKLTFAEDGVILLDVLQKKKFNMIILDINMPRINGLQCLEEIRKDKAYDWVPVFMYSTTRDQAQIDQAYEMGANLFLKKPEGYNDITLLIKKLLENSPDSFFPPPAKEIFIIDYRML